MKTKWTKKELVTAIRMSVKSQKEWIDEVRQMSISQESKDMAYYHAYEECLADLIAIANIIERKLK